MNPVEHLPLLLFFEPSCQCAPSSSSLESFSSIGFVNSSFRAVDDPLSEPSRGRCKDERRCSECVATPSLCAGMCTLSSAPTTSVTQDTSRGSSSFLSTTHSFQERPRACSTVALCGDSRHVDLVERAFPNAHGRAAVLGRAVLSLRLPAEFLVAIGALLGSNGMREVTGARLVGALTTFWRIM